MEQALKKVLEAGLINEQDFEEKKKQILKSFQSHFRMTTYSRILIVFVKNPTPMKESKQYLAV